VAFFFRLVGTDRTPAFSRSGSTRSTKNLGSSPKLRKINAVAAEASLMEVVNSVGYVFGISDQGVARADEVIK
jgi:hypothetical protein